MFSSVKLAEKVNTLSQTSATNILEIGLAFFEAKEHLENDMYEEFLTLNCRFIFTANELKKIQPALCSRLLLVSFDMTASQIQKSLSSYKERVMKMMNEKCPEVDQSRVNQIIDMYYPDYRSVANHLEFEFI